MSQRPPPQPTRPRPPHLVHVVATRNFAGVERYVTYVAPGLVQRGWRVTVVGGDPERMGRALAGSGVELEPFTGRAALVRWLRRRAASAAIVHAHMTAAEFAVVRALGDSGPRLVATRHFAQPRGSSWVARLATRNVSRRLAAQIAISQFVADRVGEPTTVIANGVPDLPMGAHDRKVVLLAQRLEAEKHTAVALRAWAMCGLAAEGWRLHIAGDGAQREQLTVQAADLGVADSVTFLGMVERPQELMGSAAIFVATAPGEPFGLSVAEAMSTGASVIAADAGGHTELLAEGAGVLVPPKDAEALAQALVVAAAAGTDRVAMGAAAQRRQRERFSLEAHVRALDELYRSLLPHP